MRGSPVREEEWEEFSRRRLAGRPTPPDVRVLLEAQQKGRGHPFEQLGVSLLEAGAQHPLTDFSYLTDDDRTNPDIMANCAAFERMAEHLKIVAVDEDSCCYGYWLHPEQRADPAPPVVMVDSEGTYSALPGRSFAEACLGQLAYGDDELFARIAAELDRLGAAVSARSSTALSEPSVDPDPAQVHSRFYDDERGKHGLPT